MDLSLQDVFDRARASGAWLTPAEADLVFAAAVRVASENGAPPLPGRIVLAPDGHLSVSQVDPPERRAYLAPELLAADPPRRTEPRVQVFAGGALGYELFTGRQPPESPQGPGPELTGPLGDLVRVAMAADRRERFGDLQQLLDAVEVVQPRRPSGDERALLGALHARASRWGKPQADESALRETLKIAQAAVEALSKRMSQLEADLKNQRSESGAAMQRMGVAVAEMEKSRKQAERERDEAEDRATLAAIQKKPSMAPVLFLSAVIASALTGAAIIFGLYQLRPELFSPMPPPPQYTQQRPEGARLGTEAAPATGDPSKADPPKPADLAAKADPTRPADPKDPKAADPTPALDGPGATPGATTGAPAGAARADGSHAAIPEAPKADLAHPDTRNAAAPPLVAVQAPSSTTLAAPARPALPPPDAQALPLAPLVPADKAVKPNKASGAVSPGRMALSVARSHVVRGDKALERGNMEDALAAYDAALANSPELPDAIRGKGTVYASQGKDKEALAEYEHYLRLAPNAPDAEEIRSAATELKNRSKLGEK